MVIRRFEREVTKVTAEAEADTGSSVALVLVGKAERLEAEFQSRYPWAKERSRTFTYASSVGMRAGAAAGHSASIARGQVGGVRGSLGR